MTKEEIDARFAALDERIAELDAQLAVTRALVAALDGRVTEVETGPVDAGRVVLKMPLPWVKSADGSRWTAELPGGRPAVVERLDDGLSFAARVGDVTGPVCAGVLAAADWCAEQAAR